MNTRNLQHILVATDFSHCAINALNTAIIIAKRQQANLDKIIRERRQEALTKSVLRLEKAITAINQQH